MKSVIYVNYLTPSIVNTKYKIFMLTHCIFYKQPNPFDFHLVPDDGLNDKKAFPKVKKMFLLTI